MSKTTALSIAALTLLTALAAPAAVPAADPEALGFEHTPPRLSFVDGDVSFFRPGAPDWSQAEVNTPLSAGDELYAAEGANLEVQIGPRGYLRAGEETQLALTSLEPDFLQLRVSEGHVSLDLRTLKASQSFEVDTPNAAFSIERSGYYRIEVAGDTTTFISRRGGRASVTPAQGTTATIASSEQVVISGIETPQIETYAAPELDDWDRWNYARTDRQLDAVSARYVSSTVYGVDDLDHHGDWRLVPSYGAIWVPRGVAVGWAPYTNGRWIYDPYYGWSWLDAAPWGWAPYHYGRWVYVSGYWGWAPGPLVVRPYYAPALVAFFGGGGWSVGVSIGAPRIGWVALGWGEPIVPWWGPRGWRGVPRWAGWGGPRVVNNVVIRKQTVVHVRDVREYQNQQVHNAFVAVDRKHFGRRGVAEARVGSAEVGSFRRVEGDLDVRPARESLAPSGTAGRRPPGGSHERAVVATRAPRPAALPELADDGGGGARRVARAEPPEPRVRLVEPARDRSSGGTLERPPFGRRGEGERSAPPPPPRYHKQRAGEPGERAAKPTPTPRERAARSTPARPERAATPTPSPRERAATPAAAAPGRQGPARAAGARERPRELPGEPANRVYRQHGSQPRQSAPAAPAAREREAAPQGHARREARASGGPGEARNAGKGRR